MPGALRFEWWGVELDLLPGYAVHHVAADALLVADLHLGKPASFRSGGIPVPEAVTRSDLERLSALVEACGPRRLVVLGDLAHDVAALDRATLDLLDEWRRECAEIRMQLVPGNHDRRLEDLERLGFEVLPERIHLSGLDLVHATCADERTPTLGGHVHPRIRLFERRGEGLRVPCFWFSGRAGILPAFGSFTGGHLVRPREEDVVFAAGPEEVVRLGPGVVKSQGAARSQR